MVPIKNGVVIHLTEYDSYIRADVYKMDSVYIFIGTEYFPAVPNPCHARVTLGSFGMKRESQGYQMVIVSEGWVQQIVPWHEPLVSDSH